MRHTPNPETLEVCLDGIGSEICDAHILQSSVPNDIATRKYTVRYIIPTVSSNDAHIREMIVSANSAADAVRTVLAAHPEADIYSVE